LETATGAREAPSSSRPPFQTPAPTLDPSAAPLFNSFSEIYRIVSQKQITDGGSEGDKPGGSQTINLQPTLTDTKDKKACCNN